MPSPVAMLHGPGVPLTNHAGLMPSGEDKSCLLCGDWEALIAGPGSAEAAWRLPLCVSVLAPQDVPHGVGLPQHALKRISGSCSRS